MKTANVDWKEDILPKEERRLHVFSSMKISFYLISFLKSRNFLSPQHSKMKDLESNRDVFGNGPYSFFYPFWIKYIFQVLMSGKIPILMKKSKNKNFCSICILFVF